MTRNRRNLLITFLVFVVATCLGAPVSAKTNLTLWIVDFNAEAQRLLDETVLPAFEANYPATGVEVEYIGWDVYTTKLTAAFAGGVAPDVFQCGAHFKGSMAEQGFARPIDKLTGKWPTKRDFFPGTWEAVAWKGKDYGVPYNTTPRSFFYRTDLFLESGLDPRTPPATWEQLRSAFPKLTRADGQGNVSRLAAFIPSVDFHFWVQLLGQAGTSFVSEDGNQPRFNSPEGLEASNYYLDLYLLSRSFGTVASGASFITGGYAMQYGSAAWFLPQARRGNPSIIPYVEVAPPLRHRQQVGIIYTDWLAISTQSKHPEEAFELIKWLVQPDYLTEYNKSFFSIPPRRATISSPYVQGTPILSQVMERVVPHTISWPSHETQNQYLFADTWTKVAEQKITPQQAVEDLARAFIPITAAGR